MSAFLQANLFLFFLFFGAICGITFFFYNKLKLKKPFVWLTDAFVITAFFASFFILNLWLNNGILTFWIIAAAIAGFISGQILFAKYIKKRYNKVANDRTKPNKPN